MTQEFNDTNTGQIKDKEVKKLFWTCMTKKGQKRIYIEEVVCLTHILKPSVKGLAGGSVYNIT